MVVTVVTNSMDAETGMAGGAAINVLTKSGTNSFHGTVFEHHINSALKARNVFYFDPDKPKFNAEPVGRHAWRADRQEQAVLLRQP